MTINVRRLSSDREIWHLGGNARRFRKAPRLGARARARARAAHADPSPSYLTGVCRISQPAPKRCRNTFEAARRTNLGRLSEGAEKVLATRVLTSGRRATEPTGPRVGIGPFHSPLEYIRSVSLRASRGPLLALLAQLLVHYLGHFIRIGSRRKARKSKSACLCTETWNNRTTTTGKTGNFASIMSIIRFPPQSFQFRVICVFILSVFNHQQAGIETLIMNMSHRTN